MEIYDVSKYQQRLRKNLYIRSRDSESGFTDSLAELLKKDAGGRGVKVTTSGNRIYVDVYVIIKYGVSIGAVADSLREAIKYKVENFTGMIVDTVNVNVIGVKL